MKSDPLFEGNWVRLTGMNLERDPAVETRLSADLEYARQVREQPLRPLSAFELKKHHEEALKEAVKTGNTFYFVLRRRDKEEMIGFLRIASIEWTHGAARMDLAITGDAADRRECLYDALHLALKYSFEELNLHHLAAILPEYDENSIALYREQGFSIEVCRRQLFFRANRYWDGFHFGILRAEWKALQEEQAK